MNQVRNLNQIEPRFYLTRERSMGLETQAYLKALILRKKKLGRRGLLDGGPGEEPEKLEEGGPSKRLYERHLRIKNVQKPLSNELQ